MNVFNIDKISLGLSVKWHLKRILTKPVPKERGTIWRDLTKILEIVLEMNLNLFSEHKS